jgi:hypothetical protein
MQWLFGDVGDVSAESGNILFGEEWAVAAPLG